MGGNGVILAAGIAALLFGGLTHYGAAVKLPDDIEAFSISAASGSFLIEAVYAVLAVAAIRLAWIDGGARRWWRLPVVLAGLATPVLAYEGSLDPWPSYPNNRGIIFALISLGLVALWFLFLRIRHAGRVRAAASHADVHHGVPPLDEELDFTPVDRPAVG